MKLLWMTGQATAVVGLVWIQLISPGVRPEQIGGLFFFDVIIVAFLTAVLANLLDWLRRPRALARASHVKEPKRQSLPASAPTWFLGQLPQKAL